MKFKANVAGHDIKIDIPDNLSETEINNIIEEFAWGVIFYKSDD
jgi:hypothetical protein